MKRNTFPTRPSADGPPLGPMCSLRLTPLFLLATIPTRAHSDAPTPTANEVPAEVVPVDAAVPPTAPGEAEQSEAGGARGLLAAQGRHPETSPEPQGPASARAPEPSSDRASDPNDLERGFSWLPGDARVVSRRASASRDTPIVEYAFGPQAQGSLGAEFGVFGQRWPDLSLRFGMYAMIALENWQETIVFPREYWRGLIGFSLATSLDQLARDLLGPGSALELTLVIGHESDHRTDAPVGLDALELLQVGQVNFATHELAAQLPLGSVGRLQVRVQERLIVGSAWSHAPAADLGLRFFALDWLQPVVNLFGEVIVSGDAGIASCPFARAMAGTALVGVFGELTPFVSLDTGCGKGLLYEERGSHVSGGVRYSVLRN